MIPLRRVCLAVLLAGATAVTTVPAARGFVLPPITGELSGEFTAKAVPGAPTLRWTLTLEAAEGGARKGAFVVTGEGLRLAGHAQAAPSGEVFWSLDEGTVSAEKWFAWLAPQAGEALTGLAMTGHVILTGEGRWTDGAPKGVIKVTWQGGLSDTAGEWSLEGVSVRGEFAIDGAAATVRSETPAEINVRTITTRRAGARNFFTRATLNADRTLSLTETRIEAAGGAITADACTWPLSPLVVDANLRITSVGLQDIAALAPAGLSDARGRVSGQVRVGWSEAEGFSVGAGHLTVGNEEPAMVRLASSPGFLTRNLEEYIELIPGTKRWLKARNPAYTDLSSIELGRTALDVESLSILLTPESDDRGRTASVKIVARPQAPGGAIGKVTIDVNVAGPLARALRVGLNQSFSLEVH